MEDRLIDCYFQNDLLWSHTTHSLIYCVLMLLCDVLTVGINGGTNGNTERY